MRKPCCDKEDINKGAWSKQEDQKLIDYICTHGEVCWRTLPQASGLHRCGKSCRLRWINYLRPDLKRSNFAEDEEDLIIKLHALLGNKWSLIAGRLPGRTDNEVKNYWNYHLRRKLINMGIDPNNHRLNRNIPTQNPNASGACATSSSSKTQASHPIKSNGGHDHVSNARNSLENDPYTLPDLNLDLTIAISPPPSIVQSKDGIKPDDSTISRKFDSSPSPSLLLFS